MDAINNQDQSIANVILSGLLKSLTESQLHIQCMSCISIQGSELGPKCNKGLKNKLGYCESFVDANESNINESSKLEHRLGLKQTDRLDLPLRTTLEIMQSRSLRHNISYMGIPTTRNPQDTWTYQEIIVNRKPDFIIEIGVYYGGQTLWFAHFCDAMNHGKVFGIDINVTNVPPMVIQHPRISLFQGDATKLFDTITKEIPANSEVLIIEDSSHTFDNTLSVLRTYSPLVKTGGWFIVEDTICHHGLNDGPNPGPWEAVDAFLEENKNFQRDQNREPPITWNEGGYLKRIQ